MASHSKGQELRRSASFCAWFTGSEASLRLRLAVKGNVPPSHFTRGHLLRHLARRYISLQRVADRVRLSGGIPIRSLRQMRCRGAHPGQARGCEYWPTQQSRSRVPFAPLSASAFLQPLVLHMGLRRDCCYPGPPTSESAGTSIVVPFGLAARLGYSVSTVRGFEPVALLREMYLEASLRLAVKRDVPPSHFTSLMKWPRAATW